MSVGFSLFPFAAPYLMLLRIAIPPGPPAWQVVLAVVGSVRDHGGHGLCRGPHPARRPADAGQDGELSRDGALDHGEVGRSGLRDAAFGLRSRRPSGRRSVILSEDRARRPVPGTRYPVPGYSKRHVRVSPRRSRRLLHRRPARLRHVWRCAQAIEYTVSMPGARAALAAGGRAIPGPRRHAARACGWRDRRQAATRPHEFGKNVYLFEARGGRRRGACRPKLLAPAQWRVTPDGRRRTRAVPAVCRSRRRHLFGRGRHARAPERTGDVRLGAVADRRRRSASASRSRRAARGASPRSCSRPTTR